MLSTIEGLTKINVNVATKDGKNVVVDGCKGSQSFCFASCYKEFTNSTAEMAELRAVKWASNIAKSQVWKNVEHKRDAQGIILQINSEKEPSI